MTGVRIVSCRSADFNMFQMTYKYNSVSSEDFGSLKFPWKKVQHSEYAYAHDLRYMVVVTLSSPLWRLINFFLIVDDQRRDFSFWFHSFFATFLYENEALGLEQAAVVIMATRVLRPLKMAFLCIPPERLTTCKIWRGVENVHFPRCLIFTETCS